MYKTFAIAFVSAFGLVSGCHGQVDGIDVRDMMEEMEYIWVDNDETNSNGFLKGVSPCLNYALGSGEQTSAQRVRFAFHDFVTANVANDTGGMDASLGFESTRGKEPWIICERLYDFLQTSPAGVPGPGTDLETTLAQFSAARFDASETIGLTACGHSLGRVHYTDTPAVVNSSFVTATNLDGGEPFDSKPGVLDPNNINEYLNGTENRGGPLCTAEVVADRSDYRLYISDNNATVQSICGTQYGSSLRCGPTMEWKAVDVMMDISPTGDISLSGLIRNLYTTTQPPSTIFYTTASATGNSSTATSSETSGSGTSIFGSTAYWPFNSTIDSGITSLSFNNVSYPANDNIFVLPAQSSFDSSTGILVVKSAALTSKSDDGDMSAVLYIPTAQQGTISPKIVQQNVTMTSYGTAGAYTVYSSDSVTTSSTGSIIVKVTQGDASS